MTLAFATSKGKTRQPHPWPRQALSFSRNAVPEQSIFLVETGPEIEILEEFRRRRDDKHLANMAALRFFRGDFYEHCAVAIAPPIRPYRQRPQFGNLGA